MSARQRFVFILALWFCAIHGKTYAATRLEPLTVGYSTFSGAYLPLWIAVENQLGKKYGLEIKSVYAGRIRPQRATRHRAPPGPLAARLGAHVRHHRRQHYARRDEPTSIVLFPSRRRLGRSPHADSRSVSVRRGEPPRRWRPRRLRQKRRRRNPPRYIIHHREHGGRRERM